MSSRRNADDLDRLLDRLVAAEEPEATGDLAPLLHPARVARATLVRSVPVGVAREHLAALRTDRVRNVLVAPSFHRRGFRLAAASLVAAIVLVMGAGSAVAAASGALPGDALYGVKRAAERISLAMHRDPVGRVAVHLRFAQTRLDEVRALIAAGADPSEVVNDLQEELTFAEGDALKAVALGQDDDALLAHVQDMISKHIAVLNGVLGTVPSQAQDAIQRAIDNAEKAKANVQKGRQNGRGKPDDAGKPGSSPAKSGSPPRRN